MFLFVLFFLFTLLHSVHNLGFTTFSFFVAMPITINTWPSKDGLRIGYLNINHAINKLTDIPSILFNSGRNFHVFCFAESRLSNHVSDSDVSMPG